MEEQLIEYKTAVLAKEKGFRWEQGHRIDVYDIYENGTFHLNSYSLLENTNSKEYALAPTQSLLQKWLREEKNIFVEPYSKVYELTVFERTRKYHVFLNDEDIKGKEVIFDTYEQALEAGLSAALELINQNPIK